MSIMADTTNKMVVLGVDPGHVNLGLCLISRTRTVPYADHRPGYHKYATERKLLFAGTPPLPNGAMRLIVDEIKLVLDSACDISTPDIVVIEEQYGYKQAVVAHAIQMYCKCKGIPMRMVPPSTLPAKRKQLLDRFSVSLPDPPARMKRERTISKWANVQTMRALCTSAEVDKGYKGNDHVADAFIYAYNVLIEYELVN